MTTNKDVPGAHDEEYLRINAEKRFVDKAKSDLEKHPELLGTNFPKEIQDSFYFGIGQDGTVSLENLAVFYDHLNALENDIQELEKEIDFVKNNPWRPLWGDFGRFAGLSYVWVALKELGQSEKEYSEHVRSLMDEDSTTLGDLKQTQVEFLESKLKPSQEDLKLAKEFAAKFD